MEYDIVIDDDISYWGFSGSWLRSKLVNMEGDIEVFVSSYGGDVYESIDMYNLFREYSKAKGQVIITVGAKAMSGGAIITMAGDKRKAYSNSTFMIHRAWTWAIGNAVDLEDEAKILHGIDGIQAREFSKYLGKTEEEVLNMFTKDTYYVGKDELESTNIFDEIIDSDEVVQNRKTEANAFASAKKQFVAKAEDEKYIPDFAKVKSVLKQCYGGKCTMVDDVQASGAEPVETKPANFMAKEQNMPKEEEIKASKLYMDLDASHKTIAGEKAELETKLATSVRENGEIKAKHDELKAAKETLDADLEEIVAMGYNKKVSKETMVSMIKGGNLKEAKVAFADGAVDTQSVFGVDNQVGGEDAETEKVKAQAEEELAKRLAKTQDIRRGA